MNINEIVGKIFTDINVGSGEILFTDSEGQKYKMYHEQSCCENVDIEDINGDIQDLLNYPITLAEEATNNDNPKEKDDDSYTWTFYKLATVRGYVNIRWYGSSNGYYSEGVDFIKLN